MSAPTLTWLKPRPPFRAASNSDGEFAVLEIADNPWRRAIGLLGRRGLDPGTGILLTPCKRVHTIGLRFPIDVVLLDTDSVVVGVQTLTSGQFSTRNRAAAMCIELPAGDAQRAGIAVGQSIEVGP